LESKVVNANDPENKDVNEILIAEGLSPLKNTNSDSTAIG